MRSIFKITAFLVVSWSIQAQSVSPSVLASSGGEGSSGQNTVQWTMGELAIMTLSGGDNVLTQGFHQPNLLITSSEDQVLVDMNVYPNPTQSELILDYSGQINYQFSLHDMTGKSSRNGDVLNGQTVIRVQDLPSGHYILTILQDDQIIESFQIEKTGL